MLSNLPPRIAWPQYLYSELASGDGQVAHIESHQPIRFAVDRRLQHHLVGWVLKPRAPQKPEMDWNRHLYQSVENIIHFLRRQTAGVKVLRSRQNRFVLDNQRDRSKDLKYAIQSPDQQSPGGSLVASQSSYNHVGVENQPQETPLRDNITCDSTIARANASGPKNGIPFL
jgi:hypothetical protein